MTTATTNPVPLYTEPLVVERNTSKSWYRFFQGLGTALQPITGLAGSYTNANLTLNSNGQITAAANGSSGTTSTANVTPDTHPSPQVAANDEFEYGTSIDLTGARFSGAVPWSWVNQGSATATVGAGALLLTPTPGTTVSFNRVEQALPAGGASAVYQYTCKISVQISGTVNFCCLNLTETSTSKTLSFGFFNSGGTLMLATMQNANESPYTDITTLSGYWPTGSLYPSSYVYLRVATDGAGNINFYYSPNGNPGSYSKFSTYTLSTFFTTAPNTIGLGAFSANSSVTPQLWCDWFRRDS